jgi:hypothetical protein
MKLRTCVSPEGKFIYGIHKPSFKILNLRENDFCQILGLDTADKPRRVHGSMKYLTLFRFGEPPISTETGQMQKLLILCQ